MFSKLLSRLFLRIGHAFSSYVYEPGIALPILYGWLQKQPKVHLIEKTISKLEQLANEGYNAVINCVGVGAKYLVQDDSIKPISGHVLRVEAPWMHFVTACAEDVYIIPK